VRLHVAVVREPRQVLRSRLIEFPAAGLRLPTIPSHEADGSSRATSRARFSSICKLYTINQRYKCRPQPPNRKGGLRPAIGPSTVVAGNHPRT
jgi:hypothetical protein